MKKLLTLAAAIIVLTTTCFAAATKTVEEYYKEKRPVLEGYEEVLAIAQEGYKLGGKYYKLSEDKNETGLDLTKIENPDGWGTDLITCAKFIFDALASGQNPKDFANYDVVKYLTDHQNNDGSFSSDIYSNSIIMLAINAAKADYDRAKAVQFVLSSQHTTGAWGYNDWTSGDPIDDVDYTALAMTAIAGIDGTKPAVDKGVDYLKSVMLADGGFLNMDKKDSSNSAACVLLALVDAGVDIDHSDFSKIPSKLEQFKNTDGSYRPYTDANDEFDRSATSQVFLALQAYKNGESVYTFLASGKSFDFSLENLPVSSETNGSNNSSSVSSSSSQNTANQNPGTGDMIYFAVALLAVFASSSLLIYKRIIKQ